MEKFRRLPETSRELRRRNEHPLLLSFLFLAAFPPSGSLRRAAEESLRASSTRTGIYIESLTFSPPFYRHIKTFHLCALKGTSGR